MPATGTSQLIKKRGDRSGRLIVIPGADRITILLIAAVAAIAGCSPGVKGDGVIKTEDRPISDFSALVATGGYQIKWSSGKPALTISTVFLRGWWFRAG